MEKMLESDKSVSMYTGFPNISWLNSFFGICESNESRLKYWRDRKVKVINRTKQREETRSQGQNENSHVLKNLS